MLPPPASFSEYKRRQFHRPTRNPSWDNRRQVLLSRSRATNLAVLLITSLAAISIMLNLHFLLRKPVISQVDSSFRDDEAPHRTGETIMDLDVEVSRSRLDHLVVVAGHAIWEGWTPEHALDESRWLLEPYQKGTKSIELFVEHIRKGVEVTLNDPKSLLVFSGGQTRQKASTSEASSYFRLAHQLSLFPKTSQAIHELFPRVTTEPFALDSFQNLLFSVARFKEYTTHYPSRITVVGFGMKKRRFEELHRHALKWPMHKWQYVGLDMQAPMGDEYEGEYLNGYLPYTRDLYGCHSVLLEKRRQRNYFSRFHSYYNSAPELAHLFEWCPPEAKSAQPGDLERMLFPGPLPWLTEYSEH